MCSNLQSVLKKEHFCEIRHLRNTSSLKNIKSRGFIHFRVTVLCPARVLSSRRLVQVGFVHGSCVQQEICRGGFCMWEFSPAGVLSRWVLLHSTGVLSYTHIRTERTNLWCYSPCFRPHGGPRHPLPPLLLPPQHLRRLRHRQSTGTTDLITLP